MFTHCLNRAHTTLLSAKSRSVHTEAGYLQELLSHWHLKNSASELIELNFTTDKRILIVDW